MRYAVILAGGSGTRLWPMSRASLPKQLIPFIHGKSLLQLAYERLEGLIIEENRYICAARAQAEAIVRSLGKFDRERFLGEPAGRDTLNAVGFAAAVLARRDPAAVIAVFTSDHVIEPVGKFQEIVERGFELAERCPEALVTFGIAPAGPATGFGYLELGGPADGPARAVSVFREKPDQETALEFFKAGPERYLWNSGMFVWRASTLLDCIRRYEPAAAAGLSRIAAAWTGPRREDVLSEVYPTLQKISVDYAVLEPASRDPAVKVLAVPMQLRWLDVGSWTSFAQTCPADESRNALAAARHVLLETSGTLVASSDPKHLIAAIGCEGLYIIHTPDATLVCRADCAEAIRDLHKLVEERYGKEFV